MLYIQKDWYIANGELVCYVCDVRVQVGKIDTLHLNINSNI